MKTIILSQESLMVLYKIKLPIQILFFVFSVVSLFWICCGIREEKYALTKIGYCSFLITLSLIVLMNYFGFSIL